MITNEMIINENDLENYIIDNFEEGALLEISYNRVFIPGIILFIDKTNSLIITLQLKGKLLNQTVDINIAEIKYELIELRYTYKDICTVLTLKN